MRRRNLSRSRSHSPSLLLASALALTACSVAACAFDEDAPAEEAELEEIEAPADLAQQGVVSCARQAPVALPPAPGTTDEPGTAAPPSLAGVRRPCPAGYVPVPQGRRAPKRMPADPDAAAPDDGPQPAAWGADYHYAAGYQWTWSRGAVVWMTQYRPWLSTSDFHTLGELAVQGVNTGNIVEVGWTIDRGLYRDDYPHLFVFHWVNNQPGCYNGCGYRQVSPYYYPGMWTAWDGSSHQFVIQWWQGNWWIAYDNVWMGYFPGTLWGGGHNESSLVQAFGEVAVAPGTTPCTDMGWYNHGVGGPMRARMHTIYLLGDGNAWWASMAGWQDQWWWYNVGFNNPADFFYGGPGGC
ncbi:MAG TPA: neprosin family prolyl endopeptidase [Kofleriaceae bacterium]|nr:neprosin family prolyl endopeptidase [Kofleriaceae bacterium]